MHAHVHTHTRTRAHTHTHTLLRKELQALTFIVCALELAHSSEWPDSKHSLTLYRLVRLQCYCCGWEHSTPVWRKLNYHFTNNKEQAGSGLQTKDCTLIYEIQNIPMSRATPSFRPHPISGPSYPCLASAWLALLCFTVLAHTIVDLPKFSIKVLNIDAPIKLLLSLWGFH